ncbi:hypothetical protein [Nocardia sp. NPDC047038]|uniref:hypothetical protein n=1 Tax=Nocardia sp. NPDC047038 TaxID=3154338 RepID=UPI0033C51CEA
MRIQTEEYQRLQLDGEGIVERLSMEDDDIDFDPDEWRESSSPGVGITTAAGRGAAGRVWQVRRIGADRDATPL